ncbi:MAG TPA: Phenylacetic acid catabolic protein [Candidatus Nitrosotenuis sp.]|jgi:benzoyl-CoA 2,3-dioxygenase component B|nr:Phenylacetic acid catabolic protein [Candidatus Nitrosotenuis sp.]
MGRRMIKSFDDWKDYFREWQRDLGLEEVGEAIGGLPPYEWHVGWGELKSDEIEFGGYRGQRKWETLLEIPDQRARDALFELIKYQGDTEFASTEQQRQLLHTAPSQEDLKSLVRVMREEGRHGWQMAYLLVKYYGSEGRREAEKLLERRSEAMTGNKHNRRLLTTFNEPLNNWLDLFYYTELVDRDGKFQLDMLSRSAFAPLARSTIYMLNEEAYHLRTGHLGLKRIIMAGLVPMKVMQKYLNKWVSSSLDLFGKDHSATAVWAYEWGLKSRFNEHRQPPLEEKDRENLNDLSRQSYYTEVNGLIRQLNRFRKKGEDPLVLPDPRFNRKIGDHAGKPYSVTGELLSEEAYRRHRQEVLPTPEDEALLRDIAASGEPWIAPLPVGYG